MGLISEKLTNTIEGNNNILGDFWCRKCNSHLLFELIQSKSNIMLRSYCSCGTLTSYIDEDIKFLLVRHNFYQGNICHQIINLTGYENPDIKKYCVECDSFLCQECFEKHKCKKIIDATNYIFNCINHRDTKTIGFCKTCKISFCNKCIENNHYHKKHDIIYENKLNDINDIVKTFESNLNQAYNKLNELIKLKYGQKFNIKISNLFVPQKIPPEFDINDKEIILCLELLKTFLDIYIFKQKNNILNYQSIAHIIKHRDFEIVRLKDTENIKEKINPRIVSIGSDDQKNKNIDNKQQKNNNSIINQVKNIFKEEPEVTNKLINICLKIDLKEKETRENELNIELKENIHPSVIDAIKKVIKLKNGDLALSYSNHIVFIRNREETGLIINEKGIKDFVELDNGNIIIFTDDFLIVYEKKDNDNYEKRVINFIYPYHIYKIKSLSNNNIAILSFKKNEKSVLSILEYPNYKAKEIKLLDMDYEGDMIQIDNFLIICFGLLDYCIIIYYDIANHLLESVNIQSYQTYKKAVKCFKIKENKILISTVHTGIIFNVKSRQAELFIRDFNNIDLYINLGNYQLVSRNNIISQLNYKIGRLYNRYKFKFGKNEKSNILGIINVGNNEFCIPLSKDNTICLLNYN